MNFDPIKSRRSVMKVVSQFLIKFNPTQYESRKVLEDHRFLLKLIKKRNRRQCVARMGKQLVDIEKRLSPMLKKKMLNSGGKSNAYLINL